MSSEMLQMLPSKQLLEEREREGVARERKGGKKDCALKNVNNQPSVTSRINECAAKLLYEPNTLHH